MILPGVADALVDRNKFIGYCRNPDHRRGKHEARVFATALGFSRADADALRTALLAAAATADAEPATADQFDARYVIAF